MDLRFNWYGFTGPNNFKDY